MLQPLHAGNAADGVPQVDMSIELEFCWMLAGISSLPQNQTLCGENDQPRATIPRH